MEAEKLDRPDLGEEDSSTQSQERPVSSIWDKFLSNNWFVEQNNWFVSHLLLHGLVVSAVDGEGGELLLDVEDVRGEEAGGDVRQGGKDLGPALEQIRTPVIHFSEV